MPNLHKVSKDLYRSAQPTAQGMQNLEKMGIKTIVNLRSFHSDRDEIKGTGLGYEHIYMKAWHPERKEVVRFLEIVTAPKRTPVLVHCLHGADRTGTMCALYRIAVQDWTREKAIQEMTKGGFNFHEVFDNLPQWIQDIDIESIKSAVSAPPVKVSANSLHVIWPYNVQGVWAFDDKDRRLVREPFVGAINPMIDQLVTNIPNAKVGFRLLFSSGFIPEHNAKLVWVKNEGRGNWYYCEKFKTRGWLCPALLKYFPEPPKEIYVRVEPLPKAVIKEWKKKERKGWFE
ncbi:tyrosine-protein phosphatase [Verrucomicrobiota bacterium]